jgi:hypothetical protein
MVVQTHAQGEKDNQPDNQPTTLNHQKTKTKTVHVHNISRVQVKKNHGGQSFFAVRLFRKARTVCMWEKTTEKEKARGKKAKHNARHEDLRRTRTVRRPGRCCRQPDREPRTLPVLSLFFKKEGGERGCSSLKKPRALSLARSLAQNGCSDCGGAYYVDIAAWCAKGPWNQANCQCIVRAESGEPHGKFRRPEKSFLH